VDKEAHMPEPTLDLLTLAERLEKVETQNRKLELSGILALIISGTCPPKTDPHVKLEWWIEGRQGDEQETLHA